MTKNLFHILFFSILTFNSFAQVETKQWEKNVRVNLYDPTVPTAFTNGAKVIFKANGKFYYPKLSIGEDHFIFDSIPYTEGVIYLKAKGFETQWYTILPIRETEYSFAMGKPGSEYTIQGKFLYPYNSIQNSYAVKIRNLAKDSVIPKLKPFLDSLNLSVSYTFGKNNDFVILKTNEKLNSQKLIFDLLNHPNISDAGESISNLRSDGFTSIVFNIRFIGATTEGKKEIMDKYK
ncbi:MAG: hypothetical protein ACJASM_002946, partial [Salibacteraceae bacterium]